MANVLVRESSLEAIADAIREKLNTQDTYKPSEMANAIEAISGGGITPTGTISITENGTHDVTNYASANVNVSGESEGFTNEDIIARRAPAGAVTMARNIYDYEFYNNKAVTSIVSTAGTAIGPNACYGATSLKTFEMPTATTIGANSFRNCTSLEAIYLPLCTINNVQYVFSGCTKLLTAVLPSAEIIQQYVFQDCTVLKSIDMKATQIKTGAFRRSPALDTLVLRNTSVVTLAAIAAFEGTRFATGEAGGTLYVPNDLIASYQAASNWSTILGYTNNRIKSIESTATDPDAPIDLTTHYIDGTAIPTT